MTRSTSMQFDAKVDDLKGRMMEAWGDLTDDDVRRADGRWDQMIATIRERTGESIETIAERIDSMIDTAQDMGTSNSR